MKSRMDRYYANTDCLERSTKNNHLYEERDNNTTPSSNVAILDNISEIDVNKIKELLDSREGYRRVKKYHDAIKTSDEDDEPTEYDIYEDIENKIYDINSILEEARSKRGVNEEREQRRKLKNTQYDILSKLQLTEEDNKEQEEEEMVSDFFAGDKSLTKIAIKTTHIANEDSTKVKEIKENTTMADLFANLKSVEDTVLTEPVKSSKLNEEKASKEDSEDKESNTFYTSVLSFTKEDFEEIHHLQSTVKSNNRLIRILIFILIIIVLGIGAYLGSTFIK